MVIQQAGWKAGDTEFLRSKIMDLSSIEAFIIVQIRQLYARCPAFFELAQFTIPNYEVQVKKNPFSISELHRDIIIFSSYQKPIGTFEGENAWKNRTLC